MQLFNNKWPGEKVAWRPTSLPLFLDNYSGVVPLPAALHSHVGSEVALFIIDRTAFAHEIARLSPFRLQLTTGLIPCPSGPVLFLLYWLKRPEGDEPFAMFENTLNPHDNRQLQVYWDLARQTHWHVFVLGQENEELNWFEFENNFGLDRVAAAVARLPCKNFMAAKHEFESQYSIEDLFELTNR